MAEDEIKKRTAQQCAKLFLAQMQMASVPGDVQLMAIEMLAKTVFMTSVKAERRLQLLDDWLGSIRKEVKDDLNPKKKVKSSGK